MRLRNRCPGIRDKESGFPGIASAFGNLGVGQVHIILAQADTLADR